MNTITKLVVLASLCFFSSVTAQDSIQKSDIQLRLEFLQKKKEFIAEEEKNFLKMEVEQINDQLEKGIITKERAAILKEEKAKKRALNIENREAIAEYEMALIGRNGAAYKLGSDNSGEISLGVGSVTGLTIKSKNKLAKYDQRTSHSFLFGIGFNNTLIKGQSLDDSPYKIGGSGFVEAGWIWNTRILENSNFVRINYGVTLQWNKLSLKNNQYFVADGDETNLETYTLHLKKSKFRTTSLVVPVHFEFGPSKLNTYEDHFRYSTKNQFKIGLGGFAGLNLSTQQKLKYKEDGKHRKVKDKDDYNTNNLMYGLSGYVGVGDVSVYAKYNLNTLFKSPNVEQRNVSLGLRWLF